MIVYQYCIHHAGRSRVLVFSGQPTRAALQSLPEEEIMLQLPAAVRPRFAEYE